MKTTAIHEAGHAVIGRVLGLPCGGATIIANEAEDEAGHSVLPDEYDTWAEWEARGRYREMRTIYLARTLAVMAGAEAEREFFGQDNGGDYDDRHQIIRHSEQLVPDDEWPEYELRLRHQARRLVHRHRIKIERVASALQERGTLQAQEIDLLMADTCTERH